jgi:hypothetical protein
LRAKPRGDFLAVIALNLDDALLGSSARPAMPLERFRNFSELAFVKSGHDAHRTSAPPLAHDANDTVVRYARGLPLKRRHAALLRQARTRALPNGLGDEAPCLCLLRESPR